MEVNSMSEKVITPDLAFVKDVVRSGGETLKKCFQCANCTAVCTLTPEEKPFPRKEMVQAQWGLKEELFSNPDIWLCHQCSDCTAYCPRDAKPGEVLGAVRKLSIEHYSKPSFLAKMVGSPAYLVPLIAVPVVLFLVFMYMLGNIPLSNIPRIGGAISFRSMMPLVPFIDGTFILAFTFGAVMLLLGVVNYWKDLSKKTIPQGSLMGGLITTIKEIVTHERFGQCGIASGRKLAHLAVFFGFIGLAVTTGLSFFYEWGLHRHAAELRVAGESVLVATPAAVAEGTWEGMAAVPMSDPLKWLRNLSALLLAVGVVLVLINRVSTAAKAGSGSYYDWLFIGVVISVGATGILAQFLRIADSANAAYTFYFLHLVSIFFLFAYAPYSKMAHMLYRAAAMTFGNMTGRK
jgi:quinone-modifying oxidoreductase subunit QmoC